MNGIEASLLVAAAIVAAATRRQPRALLWIAVGALSFVITALWWRSGIPGHAVVTGLVDAVQVRMIIAYGRSSWERLLWKVWLFSVLVSAVRACTGDDAFLFGTIPLYASLLEAVNVAALVVIAAPTVREWIGGVDRRPDRHRGLGLAVDRRDPGGPDRGAG